MANVTITIFYNPTLQAWSLSADGAAATNGNVVGLKQSGRTPIQWKISFPPDIAVDSDIGFSTDPNKPGIAFSATPPWPGSTPEGNANVWTSTVDNAQNGQAYYFAVNAVLDDGDGNTEPLYWDPEVQEDPPNVVV